LSLQLKCLISKVATNRRERETELRCQLFQPREMPLLPPLCNRLAFRPPLGIMRSIGPATHRRALPVSAAAPSAGPGRVRRVRTRRPPPAATGTGVFASHSRRTTSFFVLARILRPFAHRSTPLVVVFTQVLIKQVSCSEPRLASGLFLFPLNHNSQVKALVQLYFPPDR
jgi:hypothetical protein